MSAAVATDKMAALATAANEARGLAMDSIAAAHSGHMGLPLGCAEVGAILYGSEVCYFTADVVTLLSQLLSAKPVVAT
jgi:transketolase